MEGRREFEPAWILRLSRPYSTRKCARGDLPHSCSASSRAALHDGHSIITAEENSSVYGSMTYHFGITSFCSTQSLHPKRTACNVPPSFNISLPVFPSSSNALLSQNTERHPSLLFEGGRLKGNVEVEQHLSGGMKSTLECCKMMTDIYDTGDLQASASYLSEVREAGVTQSFQSINSFRTNTCAEEELYDLHDDPLMRRSSSGDCIGRYADLPEGYDVADGLSQVILSGPLLEAVEARGMDHFSGTVIVASSNPESDSHMSGTCSPIHPGTQDEPWSDIVLTKGQDPGSCVVVGPAAMGTAKVPDGAQAAQSGHSLSIEEHHADPKGFDGFWQCVRESQHSLQVCSKGMEFPTVSPDRDISDMEENSLRTKVKVLGQDRTDRSPSLPARLLHRICQRVRAYDHQRTNKSHLLIVGSTALIGLTLAVVLVYVTHAMLEKNTGGGNPFIS